VTHVASGSLLAARALQAANALGDGGLSVIVDVGAMKTEVALVSVTAGGVREIRTVGSDQLGGDVVRDAIVELCLIEMGEGRKSWGTASSRHSRATFTFPWRSPTASFMAEISQKRRSRGRARR
jgi:hypothetical protein